jgi:hypothetical protein
MNVSYRVIADDVYLEALQRLSIRQVPALRFMYQTPWIWWGASVIYVLAIILVIYFRIAWVALPMFALLLMSLYTPRHFAKTLARARGRSPLKDAAIHYSIDDSGLGETAPFSNLHIEWLGFSRFVEYPDGVLLELKTKRYIWLPDSAITAGTPTDFRRFLGERIR